jgi:hypothetical protein
MRELLRDWKKLIHLFGIVLVSFENLTFSHVVNGRLQQEDEHKRWGGLDEEADERTQAWCFPQVSREGGASTP